NGPAIGDVEALPGPGRILVSKARNAAIDPAHELTPLLDGLHGRPRCARLRLRGPWPETKPDPAQKTEPYASYGSHRLLSPAPCFRSRMLRGWRRGSAA